MVQNFLRRKLRIPYNSVEIVADFVVDAAFEVVDEADDNLEGTSSRPILVFDDDDGTEE